MLLVFPITRTRIPFHNTNTLLLVKFDYIRILERESFTEKNFLFCFLMLFSKLTFLSCNVKFILKINLQKQLLKLFFLNNFKLINELGSGQALHGRLGFKYQHLPLVHDGLDSSNPSTFQTCIRNSYRRTDRATSSTHYKEL